MQLVGDEHKDCKMKTIFKDAVQHRQVHHQVHHLVDEDLFQLIKEKDDIIEQNIIEMNKSITDENEDETSLKGIEGDNIHDFATLPTYTKSQSVYDTTIKMFLDACSQSGQNIDLDHRHDAVRQQFRRPCELEVSETEPHSRNPRLLIYGRQNI